MSIRGTGDLWDIVERENIFIAYDKLANLSQKTLGFYYWDPAIEKACIVLDNHLDRSPRLFKCVLAEEIGHYFTAPRGDLLLPYFSYSNHLLLSKDEYKALKWACNFLMPDDVFRKALCSGCQSIEELADSFDVTPWMVYHKLRFF